MSDDNDEEFMSVVDLICSHRTDGFWDDPNGIVHMLGRGTDGKTECGVEVNFMKAYSYLPNAQGEAGYEKLLQSSVFCATCKAMVEHLPRFKRR